MFQPNNQLPVQINTSAAMQVDQNETALVVRDEMQNGGISQAKSIMENSVRLEDDLRTLGVKIKQHEDNIKLLKSQRNKLDGSILDMQVILGKYHSSTAPKCEIDNSHTQSEEETAEQILQHERSAAAILQQIKTRHFPQALHLPLTKDVVGIVATLGRVDDENLSRIFSEYLGVETMLAIVCKSLEGVKALETYNNEGCINKGSGLHGLGSSIGRVLDGRFLVICLENLRPYAGDFVVDDPQRRLDLIKPRLPNGDSPAGFLGFAVNMINLDNSNLFFVTASGHGLRETLFYNLFSRLQVYKTRAEMILALPCISEGAISLDGGMIRNSGLFFLGSREDVNVRFPRAPVTSDQPSEYIEAEKQMKEMKWKKENLQDDMKREQVLLDIVKSNFVKKKEEFVKFLAESASYAAQVMSGCISNLSLLPMCIQR